ncbi:helix-turn-helix transcriptional regulator [Symbiopectobacterium sp. Eva_TO]
MEVHVNQLRQFRKRVRLTQSELARIMGCTPGAICHYEHGRRNIDIKLAQKIVQVLNSKGVSIGLDDLFPSINKIV